jgi:XTP/dITP diphosphohydrolase
VALLEQLPFEIIPLGAWPAASLPAEGTHSYAANALLKARAAARLTGALALADDSGLEVDALAGAPGVRSARFGGEHLTDRERCAYLLEQMRGVPPERRTARFRCAIALASPDGREATVAAAVEGHVAERPRGDGGFGYDPLFLDPRLGRTFAELAPELKSRVSHRALALRAAAERLERW